MLESIRRAKENGVAVGAHPSFEDRENFGRKELKVKPRKLFTQLVYQIGAFSACARRRNSRPTRETARCALQHGGARSETWLTPLHSHPDPSIPS